MCIAAHRSSVSLLRVTIARLLLLLLLLYGHDAMLQACAVVSTGRPSAPATAAAVPADCVFAAMPTYTL